MSIRKDLVIKVSNGSATLDMPLQIYEKDHGIELRFKLMDYKYKYDKDPDNILNSNKDDILEAYTTIINPIGYELAQINGEVIDDIVKFMIEDSYTDELEELGIYQLQIHVKCKHSEFSIPPVQFEVLERLKGEKVVTDGDDEVDYSDIIDGSTKFIDDETGKLIIEWQKGDTISSVRLNAMVEVINNAVDEETQRQLNEAEREQQELEREQQELEREQQELEREQQELERENMLQTALNSVDARVDESMNEYETRFNALTASQQQDMEVIDARDGEVSLKARLDRDVRNQLQVYEDVEDSHISCDSTVGYAQNVEILGNTIQDADNLADIRSVGDKVEGQELYKIDVVSCSKNLFDGNIIKGFIGDAGIADLNATDKDFRGDKYILCKPNTNYKGAYYVEDRRVTSLSLHFFDKDYKKISHKVGYEDTLSPENAKYIMPSLYSNNLAKGIVIAENENAPNQYEPHQKDKLTILSPVQLEKVGDVADRIICKDGVWGVEKNIVDVDMSKLSYSFSMTFGEWVIGEVKYGGSSRIYNFALDNSYYNFSNKGIVNANLYLTNGSPLYNGDNEEGRKVNKIGLKSDGCYIRIEDSIAGSTTEEFNAWIKSANIKLKLATTQPQFIPLPQDQQVKLRTFANKTNIHFETEIEGTIKAQVPKSIGATINTHTEQIDNLNKELDKVKKLEESTVSTVTTESDFTTVIETTNGYFEDVKLEGKTLVNLWGNKSSDFIFSGQTSFNPTTQCVEYTSTTNRFSNCFTKNFSLYKPNTKYTIVVNVLENTFKSTSSDILKINSDPGGADDIGVSTEIKSILGGFIGVQVCTITTPSDLSSANIAIRSYIDNINSEEGVTLKFNMIVLEGDHTQNPPEYFEGLMSVGEDVEEISVESVNENLFSEFTQQNASSLNYYDDVTNTYVSSTRTAIESFYACVETNGRSMCMNFDEEGAVEVHYKYTNNKPSNFEEAYLDSTNLTKNTFISNNSCHKYLVVTFRTKATNSVSKIRNVSITVNTTVNSYTPHQSIKKPLLYYNPSTETWEKPILRQWDSIEKHADGKYYYHKRSGEVVLNGSEDWIMPDTSHGENTHTFYIILEDVNSNVPAALFIADKFNYIQNALSNKLDVECITNNAPGYYQSLLIIMFDKNKAQDKDSFLLWLQSNPVTVVYQLAQEEIYECINIDLITYENETNFIVNTGAIIPKSSLKVICNIANVVRELQQKVSNLENYIQHVMIDALNNALNE